MHTYCMISMKSRSAAMAEVERATCAGGDTTSAEWSEEQTMDLPIPPDGCDVQLALFNQKNAPAPHTFLGMVLLKGVGTKKSPGGPNNVLPRAVCQD